MQMSRGIIYSMVYTECLLLAGHCSRTGNIWVKRKASSLLNQQGVEKTQGPFPVSDVAAAAAAKSLRSCPTLCDSIDSRPPGSPIPGILQARTLEWVAISFSNALKVKVKLLSRVQLFRTPWTAAYQAPPSMGFSRQEYWSGVPSPSLRGGLSSIR